MNESPNRAIAVTKGEAAHIVTTRAMALAHALEARMAKGEEVWRYSQYAGNVVTVMFVATLDQSLVQEAEWTREELLAPEPAMQAQIESLVRKFAAMYAAASGWNPRKSSD